MASLGKGWIKLYRQSENNPLYFSEPFDKWHAWQDLLLMVNHEAKQFISKGQLVRLKPGQMITSIAILAKRWKWSENKVRRYFRLLNGSGMCTTSGRAHGTLITIENWAKFQDEGQADGRGNGSADGRPDGRADGRLTRMIKNEEEDKKYMGRKRQPFQPPAPEDVRAYCEERENDVDPEQFVDYYAARGWELTKGRKMKDWKAAVRTWERNDKKWQKDKHPDNHPDQRKEYEDIVDWGM